MLDRIIFCSKKMIFSATRMEYLVICGGERCQADMLNMFENFHKGKEEEVIRRVEENKLYQVSVNDYKQRWSLKAIRTGLLNLYSKPTIIKNLEGLVGSGLITMGNVINEKNSNIIEGREIVFREKKVQEEVNKVMEELSKRPMPSEVLELIEKRKESGVPCQKFDSPPCQKFDSPPVKNLTTKQIDTDFLFYKEENENFKNLGFGEISLDEVLNRSDFNINRLEVEKKNEIDVFRDENILSVGEEVKRIIEDYWVNDFQRKEYLLRTCKIMGENVDIDKSISVYLLRFVAEFPMLKNKERLLKKKGELFQRFVTFVFDSITFYNQKIGSDGDKIDSKGHSGKSNYHGKKYGSGGEFTKADEAIINLLR